MIEDNFVINRPILHKISFDMASYPPNPL